MARAIKQKDINLILAMDRKAGDTSGKAGGRVLILVIILIIVLCGAGYSFYYTEMNVLKGQAETVELYLNDPTVQAAYEASFAAQDQARRMTAAMEELTSVLINLSGYPDMNGEQFAEIYGFAGTRVALTGMTYNRSSGVLQFNAACDTVTGVPIFITQLRMSGIFSDVQYQGYTEVVTSIPGQPIVDVDPETGVETITPTTIEKKAYNFSVSCLVKHPQPELPEINREE
ncbi:MAG: hypothetical protein LBS85_07455 [Clostridiales Family XIII bacterium]|jgi:hypothetical protein|nr:hypothetical protein [Clostridiales Family XIII bacterium]